jgi:cell volume regulation protein A
MFPIDRLILVAGLLLVLGIVSSKLSTRVGLPVLVLFLLVGMLAGSEGIGGIAFENYPLAHGLGTIALVLILFDGGLRTEREMFRVARWPAFVLATVGVVLTALIMGVAVVALFDVPWLNGLLLGSIVSSTDAAAVFAVFRSKGMSVRKRLAATLEVESGSNDPMAVLLTVACLELLLGGIEPGPGIAWFFVRQLALGALIGWLVGRGSAAVISRIKLDAPGLYPVLTGAAALLAYGVAAVAGGSGFLSVYLAGVVFGARRIVFRHGVFLFHDGLAWLSQIAMFVLLGLLSFPSRLAEVAEPSLLVAAVLVFLARPVAVVACLVPFRFSTGDITFIAWGGLKGSVPVILATYPFMWGLPEANLVFDIVFFVVLVSAVTQGWTLPYLARILGLREPAPPETAVTLEITSLRDVEGDIVEYALVEGSRAVGRRVRDLALPEGVLVAMIVREQKVVPPRGSTQLMTGDHAFVLLHPSVRALVDRVFSPASPLSVAPTVEFPLRGETRLGDLEEFYGIRIDAPASNTLDEFLRMQLGERAVTGESLALGDLTLTIREMVDGRVETAGLTIEV